MRLPCKSKCAGEKASQPLAPVSIWPKLIPGGIAQLSKVSRFQAPKGCPFVTVQRVLPLGSFLSYSLLYVFHLLRYFELLRSFYVVSIQKA
jgi:hypothetical protein